MTRPSTGPGLLHKLEAEMLAIAGSGLVRFETFSNRAATGAQIVWRGKATRCVQCTRNCPIGTTRRAFTKAPKSSASPQARSRCAPLNAPSLTARKSEVQACRHRAGSGRSAGRSPIPCVGKSSRESRSPRPTRAGFPSRCGPRHPDGVPQEGCGHLCVPYLLRPLNGELAYDLDEAPWPISFA